MKAPGLDEGQSGARPGITPVPPRWSASTTANSAVAKGRYDRTVTVGHVLDRYRSTGDHGVLAHGTDAVPLATGHRRALGPSAARAAAAPVRSSRLRSRPWPDRRGAAFTRCATGPAAPRDVRRLRAIAVQPQSSSSSGEICDPVTCAACRAIPTVSFMESSQSSQSPGKGSVELADPHDAAEERQAGALWCRPGGRTADGRPVPPG
jgi:hypothetical protein